MKGENPRRATVWGALDDGTVVRADIVPNHDLPYLVVESAFGLHDGEWGARLSPRGYPAFEVAADLPPGIRDAKRVSNAVANLFRNGPDTPAGVRDRAGSLAVLDSIDDATIEAAIDAIPRLMALWAELPVGQKLELSWPLDITSLTSSSHPTRVEARSSPPATRAPGQP